MTPQELQHHAYEQSKAAADRVRVLFEETQTDRWGNNYPPSIVVAMWVNRVAWDLWAKLSYHHAENRLP